MVQTTFKNQFSRSRISVYTILRLKVKSRAHTHTPTKTHVNNNNNTVSTAPKGWKNPPLLHRIAQAREESREAKRVRERAKNQNKISLAYCVRYLHACFIYFFFVSFLFEDAVYELLVSRCRPAAMRACVRDGWVFALFIVYIQRTRGAR